ncbi:hypothetical protein Lal_00023923 [Lupinus albus]|nr:hypothetical protein Lal_00023923 [Lupinus albus]
MMFAFTSLGAKIDRSFNNGRGPPTIRIQGQPCHRIGSMLPLPGQLPKFAQLYIYDTEHEIQNRMNGIRDNNVDLQVVMKLTKMLDDNNVHAKSFRMASERLRHCGVTNLKLKLIAERNSDGRINNLTTVSEVAALIVGDIDSTSQRDIIMETQSGQLKRINELHASYLAFQYPLLFPYGEDVYGHDVCHRDRLSSQGRKRNRVTICTQLNFKKEGYQIPNQSDNPKLHNLTTVVDEDGYPLYRRKDNGNVVDKNGISLDNRYVVPYNPSLLMKYQAHINMEWCNQNTSIKYLFKYINKGYDRITVVIESTEDGETLNERPIDEVKQYLDCRYISPFEASWRIFGFPIHGRQPAVERLYFHLPGEHPVYFNDNDEIDNILSRPTVSETMFTSWMESNKQYPGGRNLCYGQYVSKFVYVKRSRTWKPRKSGYTIGRLIWVSPCTGEIYYLRLMLTVVKGATCYEDIRTVSDIQYSIFRDACFAMGLLQDDKEYIEALKEAYAWGSGFYLRKLFVTMLLSTSMNKPDHVWEESWKWLCDEILYNQRNIANNQGLMLSDEELKI